MVALCASLCAGASCAGNKENQNVDKAYFNGKIITMDPGAPLVEALATRGGLVILTGGSNEVLAECGPRCEKIDLEGRTIIPGLIDAHAHFLGYAKGLERLDLVGTESLEDVVTKVSRYAASRERGSWIVGRGWDQNDWPEKIYPHRRELDRAAPRNPVYLSRVCGHAAYANSEALRLAGIGRDTPDPPGGRIMKGRDGEPTGILLDEAMDLVSDIIPGPSREDKKKLLVDAAHACLAVGLVGVHEMGISGETVSIYRELFDSGELPLRITGYFSGSDEGFDSLLTAGPLVGYADNHLSVTGVKFFSDGSLGARSAALIDDYSDDPGNRGLLVTEPESLYASVKRCHEAGFRTAIHAIGDRANRIVLDVLEKVLSGDADGSGRHRIEHAQILAPEDIPRFAALGVIPSMQFIHCTSDMPWVGSRVGPDRIAGAYAWRSLLDSGCRIPGGSDFPVESINPFLGIYAAVTRRDLDGDPPDGWFGGQCLTVEEAVRAFTLDAAYASGEEELRGSLVPGKLADFVILAEDIMSIPHDAIPDIKPVATVLGGEIVYSAADFAGGSTK